MAAPPKSTYDLSWQADKGLDQLVATAFTAEEALSRPYRCRVDVLTADPCELASLDPGSWLRRKAAVGLSRGEVTCWFHGVAVGVEHLGADQRQRQRFRIELAPAFALLAHARATRVFVDQKPIEVVRQVLQKGGVDPLECKAAGAATQPMRHITQFEESDFAFASRLMEQEGACYWFVHGEARHAMVIGDALGHHPGQGEAVKADVAGGGVQDEGADGWVTEVSRRYAVVAKEVEVRDYSERHPKEAAVGTKALPPANAPGSGGRRGEADYHVTLSDGDASAYAQRIADGIAAGSAQVVGSGTVLEFRAGRRVALHGREGYDEHLLLTAVEHRFDGKGYANTFTGVPVSRLPWRPPRTTPIPRIDGLVPAKVTAAAGAQGQDEDGAYRVHLLNAADGEKDRIVRMAQPYAGASNGMHFPLQPDTEVVLAHLHGHPDRPVIVGAMHNAESPSVVAEANKSQCVIRTIGDSSIVFEDQDGSQSIAISTKKGNSLRFDDGAEIIALSAAKDHSAKVQGKSDTAVVGDVTLQSDATIAITATSKMTLSVGSSSIILEPGKITISTPELAINVSGAAKLAAGSLAMSAQGGAALDGASVDIAATGKATLAGTSAEISGKASASLSAPKVEVTGQATAKLAGNATCDVEGAMINIKGSGVVAISGAMIKNN